MENKIVGFLIIGVAVLLIFIVISFNRALTSIVASTCVHGPQCTMYNTIKTQTYTSIGIVAFIVLIGIFIIFNKEKPREIIKIKRIKEQSIENVKLKEKKKNLKLLDKEEKKIYQIILDAEGTIFQSELVDKSGFNKVKVTRILDRLEGKQLVERKRRGMTNVIVLR